MLQDFVDWMSVTHPTTVLKGWQVAVAVLVFQAMPKGRRVGSMSFLLEAIATFLRERAQPPRKELTRRME